MSDDTVAARLGAHDVDANSAVMLQTAWMWDQSRPVAAKKLVRILLNGGNQCNFIRLGTYKKLRYATAGYVIIALGCRIHSDAPLRRIRLTPSVPYAGADFELQELELQDFSMGT